MAAWYLQPQRFWFFILIYLTTGVNPHFSPFLFDLGWGACVICELNLFPPLHCFFGVSLLQRPICLFPESVMGMTHELLLLLFRTPCASVLVMLPQPACPFLYHTKVWVLSSDSPCLIMVNCEVYVCMCMSCVCSLSGNTLELLLSIFHECIHPEWAEIWSPEGQCYHRVSLPLSSSPCFCVHVSEFRCFGGSLQRVQQVPNANIRKCKLGN